MSKRKTIWVKNPETSLYQELTGKWEVDPGAGRTSSGYRAYDDSTDVFVADKPLTNRPYDGGVYHWAEIRKMQK